MRPGDYVRTPVGERAQILRLERKWQQDGARILRDGKQVTDWYPLGSLHPEVAP